jgi:glycosyltransferase involved in cell wall biosynthesis
MDSNMIRGRGVAAILGWWCRHTYQRANHIAALSSGVKNVLVSRGVPESKITVLHNWCAEELEKPLPSRAHCEDVHGLGSTFNVMYTGNLGPLQALGTVLRAAAQLRSTNPEIRFVLVGSGLEEENLKRQAEEDRLDNVVFLKRQPMGELNGTLAYADAVLVHLRDSALNRVGIPSKLQHGMAVGLPVLIGARGSASELVQHAGAGIAFEPENADALAASVRTLRGMSKAKRDVMGQRGSRFYSENMAFEVGMTRLTKLYRHIIGTN